MTTQATINNKTNSRMSDALETAGRIAEVDLDFALLRKRLENVVEDVVREAEEMAKQGRHAVEDVRDDTTYWIKKNPRQSVAYAAGAAFGVGMCIGWFTSRLSYRCDD